MIRLDRLNAIPGSAKSSLPADTTALPRLVFAHSPKDGYTAVPSPIRFPPGRPALVAFAAWAAHAGRYRLAAGPDPRAVGHLEARVVLDAAEVRVQVPIHGLTVQEAIDLVDAARKEGPRG